MSLFRCQTFSTLLHRATTLRTHAYHPSSLAFPHSISRTITTSPHQLYPRKDTQDKDSLKPTSSEYSKSGTDDAAAANEDAAFNPNKTRPDQEKKTAGKKGDGNPLEVSPGNQEVSKPRGDQEGGAQGSPRATSSGGGSAPKSGGGKSG
ncbi:hypothetical protein K469DRAFT_709451 [Zopfia rhizophila CBS 207.26]|uniref:Uncharacterized protein n=1 Tax=Zopfia rhizophila CBS 207.26 TaxID=1314779 RepID=A0A6A6ESL8_9PEZI|nr:hypothetical protein K469DRAFT_709451 [Zopfia rhizophila CBS 207.26]